MAQKLAFELARAGAFDRYAIRLLDETQIAALSRAEGVTKALRLEPVVVTYDEGGGELFPVDGFDDKTPRGRMVMRILQEVYCEALNRITASAREIDRGATGGATHIF
jgi:hypothetical protein